MTITRALASSVLIAFGLLTHASHCLSFTGRTASAGHTRQDILRVWKERQQAFTSFRVEWTETTTIVKGSLPQNPAARLQAAGGQRQRRQAEPQPPQDMIISSVGELALQGDMMRYARRGPRWVVWLEEFVQREYISVFDGRDSRSFYSACLDGEERVHPQGYVNRKDGNVESGNLHMRPIMWTFRPLEPRFGGPDLNHISVVDEGVMSDGVPTLLLESVRDLRKEQYWLDPARGYVVVKMAYWFDDSLTLEMNISYDAHFDFGWVPHQWDFTNINPETSKIERTVAAAIESIEVNQEIPVSRFRVDFPVGTEVVDQRRGVDYFVRAGDREEPVTEEDRRIIYGLTDTTPVRTGMLVPVALVGLIVSILAAIILFRIRRKAT